MNHSNAAAAGGVISTGDDLATWIKALVGAQRGLSTALVRQLATRRPEQAQGPKVQGTASPNLAGTEHDLFSRRRDPWLRLEIDCNPAANNMTLIV